MAQLSADVLAKSQVLGDKQENPTTELRKDRSPIYNACCKLLEDTGRSVVEPQSLFSASLELLWQYLPTPFHLADIIGNAHDPGDDLLYDDQQVNEAHMLLEDLCKAWGASMKLYHTVLKLPRMTKICLILKGMRHQELLQDFISHD